MILDRRYFLAGTALTAPLVVDALWARSEAQAPTPNQTTLSAAIQNFNTKQWDLYAGQLDDQVQLFTLKGVIRKNLNPVINYLKGKPSQDVELFNPILGPPAQQWWSADNNTVIGFANWTDNDDGSTPAPTPKPIAYLFRFNPSNHKVNLIYGSPD